MLKVIIPFIFIFLAGFVSCTKTWDDHYNNPGETVNQTLWETISTNPDYSAFVDYLVEYELDSIFHKGNSLTLFIPTNDAFKSFNPDTGDVSTVLLFHIMNYVFNTVTIQKVKMAETSTGKFVQVEFIDGTYRYNDVNISYFSPLYLDGRFYVIDEVAYPKPNLYEFISLHSPPLKRFIDDFDSVILDYELSKPIGFDEFGNTIYDSVYTIVNYFDSVYFPVNKEDRNKTATFLSFTNEQYTAALDEMAQFLGGNYQSAEDIPSIWQDEVYLPNLVSTGLFNNSLQCEDFYGPLQNVRGDTVWPDPTNIDCDSRFVCSNGITYSYIDFHVPPYLYKEEIRIEGEHMIDSSGGLYLWKPGFEVSGSEDAISVKLAKSKGDGASNDSLVSIQFPDQKYTGSYALEFKFTNMFPQKYLFVWGANYRPSGIYQVYVNDELIREYDLFNLRQTVFSVLGSTYYFPVNGFNAFDALVENAAEFGDIKIKLVYKAPGFASLNGFNIDYISLIPVD